MASQPSSENPEANHDAKILAVIIVLTILSVIATVLRVVSKRMKKTKLGVEDYMIFVALALSMTQSIQVAAGLRSYGLGRHVATLNKKQLENFEKIYFEVGLVQPTILMLCKISVLLLFHRLFITPAFGLAVWFVGITVLLWWIGTFFAHALTCISVHKKWNPTVQGHCASTHLIEIGAPVPWIVTDLAVLILPLPMIYRLHMPFNQRIGLIGLFLLGGLSLVSSCIRYSQVFYPNDDYTWNLVPTAIWTLVEAYITVMSASFIVIKPVYVQIFPDKLLARFHMSLLKQKNTQQHDSSSGVRQSRSGFALPSHDLHTESQASITNEASTTNDDRKDVALQDILVVHDLVVSSAPREVV